MQGDKRFSAKDVARQIGGGHLSFASSEEMKAMLHAEQGAASILGLIFDVKQQVQVLIDKDVLAGEYMACHPCVNSCTIKLRMKDIISALLPTVHPRYLIVDLPAPCRTFCFR
jgi:Ala-tRNA(Pro) deacylase